MLLMAVIDAINEIYGRDTLFFAVQGRHNTNVENETGKTFRSLYYKME